jgi:diamine N-acetyltransferase
MLEPFIRTATPDDYEALLPLYAELDEHHRLARPNIFREPVGPRRSQDEIKTLIGGPQSTLLVALVSDRLVGLSAVLLRTVPASPVRYEQRLAEIDNIVVTAMMRRQGIARALLAASAAWARGAGASTLVLSLWHFNVEASAFYEAEGFKVLYRRLARDL